MPPAAPHAPWTLEGRAPYGEADTRAKLIDPLLYAAGWTEEHIRREETAGGIEVIEGEARRLSKGRVDYTLRFKLSASVQPVALAYIEAKAETKDPAEGLQQGIDYSGASKRFNVPFVFASNGHAFIEYDHFTGQVSPVRPMSDFPTPEALRQRYEIGKGFSLDSEAARPLLIPYAGGEAVRRYYQDAAIRAVLEALARGLLHVLLSLATGAGKTFIAVNLLKRIRDAGLLRRALFVCDRDELRSQALGAFRNLFGSDVAEVYEGADGKNNARNAVIHIATYQTLAGDQGREARNFFARHYGAKNHFSHIIIDECHRSAWGDWKFILEDNPDAVHIGLTATPRQLILGKKASAASRDEAQWRDNVEYFGEPVYEYTLSQGIEDGYLAPPEIFTFDLFHEGQTEAERLRNVTRAELEAKKLKSSATGAPITSANLKEEYSPSELDERLLLPERVLALSQHLLEQLIAHGGTPEQKTILFCASDRHAEAMSEQLGNLYRDWCLAHGQEPKAYFAFKCTAKSGGTDHVPDLRGSASSHFIACTVDLLSTGVDVPCVQNIAFMQYVRSPIVFAQMLGRGTRLDPDSGKMMFRVFDYTEATALLGRDFLTKFKGGASRQKQKPPPAEPPAVVEGVMIRIEPTGRYLTATVEGRHARVTLEQYREHIAQRLIAQAGSIADFRRLWVLPPERRSLIDSIVRGGFSPRALQVAEEAAECDLYDVLGEVGYGIVRQTRADRAYAFTYKQQPWLQLMPPPTAATVKAIANQFSLGGTEALETPHIFDAPMVVKAGGIPALRLFDEPAKLLTGTKERLFAA
ncbi:MAG TPA: DEAD/DEAH box helicase family protein [Prosthecobacter sp.]|nr:DEAD/DEAH box helicase family protein [Prosthecobacter sp.]HRK15228.1 DEAD/DEAH box helicase family protein [Prosthecobacter sp.]